jgi:peptide/nickel transport system substrate-binding protein
MDATYFVNFWTPYPQHVLGNIAPKDIVKSDYARKPLGWGAFKITEWVAGDHITLEKNPLYFRAKEGLPKVDKVIFKFIPDTNQLLAQLLSGDVDIGTSDGMPLDQVPFLLQAEKNKILTPLFQTGTAWEHLDFDLKPADKRAVFFDDVRVRQAIAYGTDRKLMVDKILYGKSKILNSYLPEAHPMYAPKEQIIIYEYDKERAKQLLKEAGWVANKDGWLEKGGVVFDVSLQTTAGSRVREQITQIFQQQMKDIGIKVRLDYLPSNVFSAKGPDGPLFGRRFDLAQFAWLTGVEPPGSRYQCADIPSAENGWAGFNLTGWCNKPYDEAVNKARGTLKIEEQKKYWAEAQRIFMQELPVLPLFARLKVAAARPGVTGLIVDATEDSEMWNIESFDVVR